MHTASIRITAATAARLDLDAGVEHDASGDDVAFRLFRAGRFETDYGATVFDGKAARDVMAERQKRGNRFALDFDHLSLDPDATPEQRRAAGSFDIAMRGGELWAVDVRLTAEARAYVRAGSYLSVSPAWDQDTTTGRVISFCNCALTSNPATHGAVRLAASRAAAASSAARCIPVDILRHTMSHAPSASLRAAARRELERRGEYLTESREHREILERAAAAHGVSRAGDSPAVVHAGRSTTFRTLTAEEARKTLAAKQRG